MNDRQIYFHKEIRRLLDDQTQRDVFRIDDTTVGVTNGPLSKAILAARPMYEPERIVFKPIRSVPVSKSTFTTVMRAVAQDARRVASTPTTPDVQMEGIWPQAGYRYFQHRLYSSDPWPIRTLAHRIVNRAGPLKPVLEVLASRSATTKSMDLPCASALATNLVGAASDRERWAAVTLYRRTARSICLTVACLVTNALWLASPSVARDKTRLCITETLRLLPPAWMYHREACKEFAELDSRIRTTDAILVIPLVTQRDPDVWPDAESFSPDRWAGIRDPEASDYYFPFGYSHDRCLARELVLLLAEHAIKELVNRGLWIDRRQKSVKVLLKSLLSPNHLKVVPV
jgi:hypothetical protein